MKKEFNSVTFFIMASNETKTLRETIERIEENCLREDIEKIVVVVKTEYCPAMYETLRLCEERSDSIIELHVQCAPNAVECVAELPPLAQSTHFIIMSADLETDPSDIKIMISKAKMCPERIICAAKWHKDSVIEGYGRFHEFGSRMINIFTSCLFMKKAKDLFSIYQIYPKETYDRLCFDNPKTFLYEYTLVPLKLGMEYEEIPTVYKNRKEGESNVNLSFMFELAWSFCVNAIRIRFTPKNKFIKNS